MPYLNREQILALIKKKQIYSNNLIFNERRQKDSLKLFEISDLYTNSDEGMFGKSTIGVIASGRID